LDGKRFDGCGWVPLGPHPGDVVLELLLRDFAVVVMEVDEEFEAGDVTKTCERFFLGGDEDSGDCCDYQIAEHGIDSVQKYKFEADCLVLPSVFVYVRQ
jgi:hypothetical protein